MANGQRGEQHPPGLMYLVKRLEQVIRSRLDEVLRPWGVTTLQYTAMTVLARRSAMTSAALARHSFVTAQSMGDLVATLERRGLVAKSPDPSHGRRLLISLTPAGVALLDETEQQVGDLERSMLAGLDKQERTQLRSMLDSCHLALVTPADSPSPAR